MNQQNSTRGDMQNNVNVLFADDEVDFQQIVHLVLEEQGARVFFADNGITALEVWHSKPINLVILDVMMPRMDGLEVCRTIRSESDVPIIMLTARGREEEIVEGFSAGADDYLIKPFRPRELVARINALLRRTAGRAKDTRKRLTLERLSLDIESRRVTNNDRQIQMSPIEFQLLKYMMQNAGIVLSKDELLRNVWGYSSNAGGMNLIEATIRRLRKKVEQDPAHPKYIQTVWGAGYRFGD
jgi:DNA-binding response OmpR family regulator